MRSKLRFLIGAALIIIPSFSSRAQFVAFNDHYVGPGTHTNATAWNAFDITAGAPGTSGPLKDIVTGLQLPVILTITNYNAGANNTSLGPNPGSAAYNIFNGYIDFSSTTLYVMIRLENSLSASVGHVLSSLDPTKRYSLKLTAVRGGNYADRWTLMTLSGALSFTSAHTAGSYTNGLQPNQVAINTGENRANGTTAVWTDIDPGPDGVVAVVSRQYTGPLPGGGSGSTGLYGYAPIALRVEEFRGDTNAPPTITRLPAAQAVFEGESIQLTPSVSGGSPLYAHWFKDGALLPAATNTALLIPSATISNTGVYFLEVTNANGRATSSNAAVYVIGKSTPEARLAEFSDAWRFNQSGTDLGSTWRQSIYDDSSWNLGRGLFYYANYVTTYPEAANTPLVMTNSSGNSILTYYFRKHFSFPVTTSNVLLLMTNLLDDGAVFYLNNVELARIRLPSGVIAYATAADSAPNDGRLYESTNLVGKAVLQAGDNVLAVELHQFIPFSSDALLGVNLRAYAFPSEPLVIVSQPISMVANEEESAIFTASIFGGGNVSYQWFRDGVAVPNATNRTLVFSEFHPRHQGFYSFRASNSVNSVTSSDAQLTIIPDTVPPRLITAYFTNDLKTIILQFSEPLDTASATSIAGYTFSPPLTINTAVMESPSAVRLTVSAADPQSEYHVFVGPITDRAENPNHIEPGATARVLITPIAGNRMLSVQTVFVIVMENHDWSTILGNPACPYINNVLLPLSSYANQYYTPNDLHPSEPNYVWMEAGSNLGILDDSEPSINHLATTNHFTTLLRQAGISWKSYQENISGDTCPVTTQYPYAARHNPFVFFDDVISDLNYCTNHNRPFAELAADLANNRVTGYNFITPNLTNDMHDSASASTEGQGDLWLSQQLPMILNSSAYSNNGAIFITWDEGSFSGPIGMIVLSPLAKGGGYSNGIYYTHSSLLRSLQQIFRVGPLLRDAAYAANLSDLFRSLTVSLIMNDGHVSVRLENLLPSKTYYLQVSSDLSTWNSISTNSASGSIVVPDPAAPSNGQRFYRLLQAP